MINFKSLTEKFVTNRKSVVVKKNDTLFGLITDVNFNYVDSIEEDQNYNFYVYDKNINIYEPNITLDFSDNNIESVIKIQTVGFERKFNKGLFSGISIGINTLSALTGSKVFFLEHCRSHIESTIYVDSREVENCTSLTGRLTVNGTNLYFVNFLV
jgi:hypothetical protein